MVRQVVVVSAVRTAIGDFGGSLKEVRPVELATTVAKAAIERSTLAAQDLQHAVFGQVLATEPNDMYIARVAALQAGCPETTPAFNVNRLCGTGLQAIVSASQSILLGDADAALAGGVESMSRAPYASSGMRWGTRMGDTGFTDMLVATLHDPFHGIHMGMTAENVAEKWQISRSEQDLLAVESHRRAHAATINGYFKDQIVPIHIQKRNGQCVTFEVDEHVRPEVSIEALGALRPVFKKEGGTVTAGNASGLNDAAAAVVLMEKAAAERRGIKPLARLVSYAHAGVDPRYMGIGPVPASTLALRQAGLSVKDLDVIESNEAFAAQACAVTQLLELDPSKVNPNGSGISLGHPVGATGAIITTKALHELNRIQGRFALVTMCIGGGQGIAAIFERC